MKTKCLVVFPAILLGLLGAASSHAQTNADGSYTVPIYETNPTSYTPSYYTIYAAIGGGPLVPYLFDTGAPNFFSVYDTDSNTTSTNGSFTFAQAPTYIYQTLSDTVSFGSSNGVTTVTTDPVDYAQVRYIAGTNGVPNQQLGNILADGTYGDFGAGLYGNSMLATILSQIPLDASLKVGYSLNLTGVGQTSLTMGLSSALLAQLSNASGAIIMSLSPSGSNIPTTNGVTISGYNKAQVSNVVVSLTAGDGSPITTNIPLVLDTGGGANAVIYATNLEGYGNSTNLTVSSTNGQELYTITNNLTPWGGNVSVDADTSGGARINSGGYFFQSNIVTFDLADGIVIIDPVPEPSALWLCLLGGALLVSYGFFQRGRPSQKGLATPSR